MQPYAQLKPNHPAYGLQGFRLGFPVTDKAVHYQGVDIDGWHLNGAKPAQFEAFTLDVSRLSPDQSTALIQLYRRGRVGEPAKPMCFSRGM